MGDYFRHARADRPVAAMGAAGRAGAGRPEPGAVGRRHPVRRRARGGRPAGNLARRCFRRRSTAGAPCPTRRWPASSRTPGASPPRSSSRRARIADALLQLPEAEARPVRAAVRDARLRAARADVSRVQGDQLPRGARLLPQVHRRRAHAADDPQPRAADGAPAPERERFARLLGELEAPELLVLALLYHDVGKWTRRRSRRRERAHGARRCSSASSSTTRRATIVEFLVARAPEDVAGRVPARHRRPGDRPAVRRAGRRRRAAEDAVPDDARRRRGGQPRNADAVEGGAALAALRRHLQLPDAVLRRRGHRARSRPRIAERHRRAAGRPLGEGDRGVPRRGCRGAICSCSRARPSIGTSGCRAASAATSLQAWLERERRRLGADGHHAGPAVPVLEHLGRARRRSAWTSCAASRSPSPTVWSSTCSTSPTRSGFSS